MESLITKYDDIFLNQSRICSLIDKFNQESQFDELDVLGKIVGGYILLIVLLCLCESF